MSKDKDLGARWVEELAQACKESLADSGPNDHMVKVFSLYDKLASKVNRQRTMGYLGPDIPNIRLFTEDKESFERICERLCDKLVDLEAEGCFTLAEDFKEDNLGAILAVTFSGFVAARLDGNFKNMEKVCEWCERAIGSGRSSEDYSIIKVAKYYHTFGNCREDVFDGAVLPTKYDLKSLLDQAERDCRNARDGDKDNYIRQLRLFLADAITQLPPWQDKPWQDKLKDYSDLLNLDEFEEPTAREYYQFSKISYAKSDKESLDSAIKYAVASLQEAPPADVHFIELCRNNLRVLEQEKAARETTKEEALKEAERKLEGMIQAATEAAKEELEGRITEETKKMHEKTREETEKIHKETRDLTKDLQMRVIEILGIFLAVTGVGVTAVGGIAVSGGFWDRLGIYVGGGLSIMLLFGFLRFGVIEPSIIKVFFGKVRVFLGKAFLGKRRAK